MSDETIHDENQGWPSEPVYSTEPTQGAAGTQSAPVAFCQDCGKALTPETMHAVGTGLFCEPCLAIRMGAPVSAPYAAAAAVHTPNPTVATLLGFIPGVGAMYNGQYAKGFVHLAIFALLISLSDHVSDIFTIFVFAWVCYMAFEAHHTAKARLMGLPLPNAFGFNDIGERMGFGKNWPYASPGPVPPAGYATPTPPAYAPPPPYAAPAAGPDWVGYVPPTQFGAAAAADRFRAEAEAAAARVASTLRDQTVRDTAYSSPYAQTYSGVPASEHTVPYVAPIVPLEPVVPSRRLPVAAFLLIGLGALILLGTLMPEWSINGRWFPPVIFAVLSLLILWRRIHAGVRVLCVIRWPAVLMVLALMSGLHAAYFDITFGMTCAVLLIVFGALLLLERTFGTGPAYVAGAPIVEDAGRASFTSAGPMAPATPVSTEAVVDDETEKGGL